MVHVANHDEHPSRPPLFQLKIVDTGGHVAPGAGIVKTDECQHCGLATYSLLTGEPVFVDPRQWDRSDIFTLIELPFYPLVTAKFAKVLEDHRIHNYRLVPARWGNIAE